MTPWSETIKRHRWSVYFYSAIALLAVLYAVCSFMVGGERIMARCAVYLFQVVRTRAFAGADYRALSLGVLSILFFVSLLMMLLSFSLNEDNSFYGEARFATKRDLKRMGLVDKQNASGIIVGKVGNRLLSPNCLRHGIALAPTRSGKTAGFVIPSALSFKGSLIITDPKGELEAMLAPVFRKMGREVYCIDWSSADSKDAWNPLSLKVFPSVLNNFAEAERQAERIAAMLVGQKNDTEDHWESNAKKHIAALILLSVYLAEVAAIRLNPAVEQTVIDYEALREPHLEKVYHFVAKDINVAALLNGDDEALRSAKQNIADLIHFAAGVHAPMRILNDLSAWYNAPENEAGSHMTTFLSKLQLWRSSAVMGATRCCSFEWQDLRDTPSVVFIKFPQRDAQSLGLLTALFFETFFCWALDVPKKPNEAPIAILADEFGSLPRINLMTDFLSKGAGMGAVIWIIVQDFAQIKTVYGDKRFDTIKTNCSYLLTYAQNNLNTQRELSQMTGKMTRRKHTETKSDKGGKSTSDNQEGADLVPVSDWGAIPFGHYILLCQGFMTHPVYCQTPLYFKEKRFMELLNG